MNDKYKQNYNAENMGWKTLCSGRSIVRFDTTRKRSMDGDKGWQ